MEIKYIDGGVTAPKGFLASGIYCGIKQGSVKKDLALIYSEVPAKASGMFTKNKVKGAPIYICKDHLSNKKAQAIIINSGNANTCTGDDGLSKAKKMTALQAKALNLKADDVLVASTGVIGVPLNIDAIKDGIPLLTEKLSKSGNQDAASAIMTTDTFMKELAAEFYIGDTKVTLGTMAKGSGMIEPNMGTMLSFITTDISISPQLLDEALKSTVTITYNRVSVDGDTSTNDSIFILANGQANNPTITEKDENYYTFVNVLKEINTIMAKNIAKDGEGATKLLECQVIGATNEKDAVLFGKSVINSSLVKTAMFGSDANWGRILCALGYANVDFDPEKVDVSFESCAGEIEVCKNGSSVGFDEDKAKKVLDQKEIIIKINLSQGECTAYVWGCDLSYEYVKINGDYRS
ncbi:bifunctional glutamate N-acetyltransferase/amino-acid acetyltransferase ArgJ [Clostridium butyricum]|uniref:bifunctional glutamate N-acetyltransferase/amino-acid acetyltransferase ArgJ n=1 Tax=Clostridium butyricum TaxID=1492 RepID=UPI0013D8B1CF|nr:bifunctional glutamate N-acetyltransferase/amino-acid acetyltransferase ArgJ [Clostridium butyricum]MCQ2016543.1 bifunctional glutamate N-acetyltransferase/amino-acid acetyltransferase ArgJ [Clostridium butyricum]MCQ2023836.1 bifunctional glutamate N-acetyltransferase/amino-acid acetyltransferase ArgJ [Clostridium butyricum]NFB69797.1 bifunctional glutamate N-acetyltransferase/amino-acid acetyltransferase ArgJ [Clostridium butyricum]NFB89054.1 bifunctional glutamate N-acetyltransferase/amino